MVVDSALPHLDREFDYTIPDALVGVVAVGSRVRVPFAGRLISAVVVAAPERAIAGVNLSAVRSSAGFPSFTVGCGFGFARSVARRYGSSLWDVLRLMAPPRVASVERRDWGVWIRRISRPRRVVRDAAGRLTADASVNLLANIAGSCGPRCLSSDRAVVPAAELLFASLGALLGEALAGSDVTGTSPSAIVVVPDSRAARSDRRDRARGGTRAMDLAQDGRLRGSRS